MNGEERGSENTGGSTNYPSIIDEIFDDSQLVLFQKQKILGGITPGSDGVTILKAAEATGTSILMGMTYHDTGEPVFGFDASERGEIEPFLYEDVGNELDENGKPIIPRKVINIAFHTSKGRGNKIYPEMTADQEGTGTKRVIAVLGFRSENLGGGDFDTKIADDLKWNYAKNRVMEGIIWIEAQLTNPDYGIIDDPMVPLSKIPMYVAGRNAIQASVDLMMDIEEDMKDWE